MQLTKMIELLEGKLAETYTIVMICGGKRTEEERQEPYVRLTSAQALEILEILKEYKGLMNE